MTKSILSPFSHGLGSLEVILLPGMQVTALKMSLNQPVDDLVVSL